MKNIKYILLLLSTLSFALGSYAQEPEQKENEGEKTKVERYRYVREKARQQFIVSSGDTTFIVNKISTGLDGEDADFLFRDKRFVGMDIYTEDGTKYNTLEEATYDTNRLIKVLDRNKAEGVPDVNRSLSYRASQTERMKLKREQEVMGVRDSLIFRKDTKKIAELAAEFGNQPTYYLNNIRVEYPTIELLFPDEILSRTIRVVNTVSGNPNGEVWYKVHNKVLVEIGLIELDRDGNIKEKKEKSEPLDFIRIQ